MQNQQSVQGERQETCAAVIVAAGSSRRMQGRDKLWLPLHGRTTLARTIDVFEQSPLITTIALVLNPDRLHDAATLCDQEGWRKIGAIVPGGARRQDSVRLGLDALHDLHDLHDLHAQEHEYDWVMIHDGARPLVTGTMLADGLAAAREHNAAIAAVPVKDTIKRVEQGTVHSTLERSQLWAVQTPQVFSFPLIWQAHHTPQAADDVTDDAALFELLGRPVAVFAGAYTNIKITTQEDVLLAELYLAETTHHDRSSPLSPQLTSQDKRS